MRERAEAPAVFFDFDNTITLGDVLDTVIERFSPQATWKEWEAEWQAGRMSTRECLGLQMGGLRASWPQLQAAMSGVAIDPAFAPLAAWAKDHGIEVRIVSDNFSPLIHEILRHHGLDHIPIRANELVFEGDRVEARFPFTDPGCPRCAHCKAQHLRAITDRTRIYVGDGLSDVCPALIADVVFAKDSLARELGKRGKAFRPFASLEDVSRFLRERHDAASAA